MPRTQGRIAVLYMNITTKRKPALSATKALEADVQRSLIFSPRRTIPMVPRETTATVNVLSLEIQALGSTLGVAQASAIQVGAMTKGWWLVNLKMKI